MITSTSMRTGMFLIVALVASCEKHDKPKEPPPSPSAAPVKDDGTVEVFINDASVAKITKEQAAKWPRLDSLLPEDDRRLGTWESLTFKPSAGEPLVHPSQTQPDKVPVVFPNKDGKTSFGMFDPVELAKKGEPALRADAVKEIRIKLSTVERGGQHQGGTGEGSDFTKFVLKITTPEGEKQLTGPDILKLPREGQPNQEDTKGWRLNQFLAAGGVTKYTQVTLVDSGGVTLPLEKKDIEAKENVPFIKLNKQGSLRFRMFTKKGNGFESGADLRALTSIQVK